MNRHSSPYKPIFVGVEFDLESKRGEVGVGDEAGGSVEGNTARIGAGIAGRTFGRSSVKLTSRTT